MATLTIQDEEFGDIIVRIAPSSYRITLRVGSDGRIKLTIPDKRSLRFAKELLDDSRPKLRGHVAPLVVLQPGHVVGRKQIVYHAKATISGVRVKNTEDLLIVTYPLSTDWQSAPIQEQVHKAAKKSLRKQASELLITRLEELSHQWEIPYAAASISSATTRWGSCTSENVIRLNMWLLQLPDTLIDYVICHELCHTIEHNHSAAFWGEVARRLPDYKLRRNQLKDYNTTWQTV